MDWISDLFQSIFGVVLLYVALTAIALFLLIRLVRAAVRRVTDAMRNFRARVRRFLARLRRLPGEVWERFADLVRSFFAPIAHLLQAVARAWRAAWFGVSPDGERKRRPEVLFRVPTAAALASAEQRLRFVDGQLQAGEARHEVVQVPPHLSDEARTRSATLSEADALVQDVVLRWERRLGERVGPSNAHAAAPILLRKVFDAVISILRVEGHLSPSPDRQLLHDLHIDLALSYAPAAPSEGTVFPWIVSIGTSNRDIFRRHLPRMADWLGVPVQLLEPARMKHQRRARSRPQGLVAGMLRTANGSDPSSRDLVITCSHVIEDDTPGVVFRGDWKKTSQPDAALLEPRSLSQTLSASSVVKAVTSDFTRLQVDGRERSREFIAIRRRWRTKRARIVGLGAGYELDGRLGNFPHWDVRSVRALERREYFWIVRWPLFGLRFSRKGDSGAWIVGADTPSDWLGLLVGAKGEDGQTSVVLCGDVLIDYLGRLDVLEGPPGTAVTVSPMLLERSHSI